MTRGTRIVAVDSSAPESELLLDSVESDVAAGPAPDDWWDEAPPRPARPWATIIAGTVTLLAIAGWTALLFLANREAMLAGGSIVQWTGWLRDWSVPVLLLAVVWLIAMRNSRREAFRFGQTARLLGDEAARLETRLTTVNRELSLAREFIAAQSRDIDSLGRVATERLSLHSDKLASLIHDNGTKIDAIQTVSASALENMEKLRGQLPVIASSAKDVTNNIATAGRTANTHVEELIGGFNKLNQFGQASERQVISLREVVDQTLAEFTRQTEQLGAIAEDRFAALTERGAEFRTQLDGQEVEALAAIRNRAGALTTELEEARKALDAQEGDTLTSLRARLSAVREESAAIGRSLREGEGKALEAWRAATAQLEEDLTVAIGKVAEIDKQALASARNRLGELAREAEELDNRMGERDQLFSTEIERRRAEFETRHGEFIALLSTQMADFDGAIEQRRRAQEEHGRKLVSHSETVATQLDHFTRKMAEVADLGGEAESRVAASMAALGDKLAASRNALSGTDLAVAQLTDSSVRLLELIQASVQHSSHDLPQAMVASEDRLMAIETRVGALTDKLGEADSKGQAVAGHLAQSSTVLAQSLGQIERLSGKLTDESSQQAATLEAMQAALERVRSESLALAEQSQSELKRAIEELDLSAKAAVAGIGEMSAASISALAARLGEESGAAIDKVMRTRAAEAAGQLEQAAAHAAGVGREAAVQLRDQLAKVSELTGHLEQRVAHARAKAEDQVDNDFARRVALITESLNSHAIDIARAVDSDVSDTAWASYLKGDRGVFTRRAVRLLETGEAKAIAQLYEQDNVFSDHVSRYIHDFEAMLRQLLSTRDGHALGVTLLSSDMGKLYVALAQAIERLRN